MKKILIVLLVAVAVAPVVRADFPLSAGPPNACGTLNPGQSYYDTLTNVAYVCNGTAWTSVFYSLTYPLLAPAGSPSAPSYSFSSTPNTGFYTAGPSTIDLATGGTIAAEIASNGWWIGQNFFTQQQHATPAVSFASAVSGLGTDVVGGGLTLRSGAGTGTARGGILSMQVTMPTTVSGSTMNSYQTPFSISTIQGALSFGGLSLASGISAGQSNWDGVNRAIGAVDQNGGAVFIRSGIGTGTGRGGDFAIQMSMPSATSSGTQNALQSALSFTGINGSFALGGMNFPGVQQGSTIFGMNRTTGVTDGAGGPLTLGGGKGTGTGAGGNLILQVAPSAASTGTTQNALQTVFTAFGTTTAVSIGGTTFAGAAAASSSFSGVNQATTVTDGAGGPIVFNAGRGTGTGAGGGITFNFAPPGPTGTTSNALQPVLSVVGTSGHVVIGGVSSANAAGASSFSGVNRVTGADLPGGALNLQTGRGTGTGAGGILSLLVSPAAASSGTVLNGLVNGIVLQDRSIVAGGWNTNGAASTSSFAAPRQNTGLLDSAGSTLSLDAGSGTGTGAGGTVSMRISTPAAVSGTTQQSFQVAVTAVGTNGAVNIGGVDMAGSAASGVSVWQGVDAAAGVSDKAGGRVEITGGQGTGTGAEGNVIIRLAPAASSTGTTQNAVVDVERWDVGGVADPQARTITLSANNGATWVRGTVSELLTLSTASPSTDTTGLLLPAGSLIEAVAVRVTTTISGGSVTQFAVGDASVSDRFSASAVGLASGSTRVGLQQWRGSVTTDTAGPVQAAAAAVRVTCNGTPTAGVVRVIVFYRQFVAPTS